MRNRPSSNRQAGFTLVEALVVVATMSLLMAAAVPKFNEFFAASAVKSGRAVITGEFQLARLVATQSARTAIVRIAGDQIWVEARPRATPSFGSIADTVGTVNDLYLRHSVTLATRMDSVVYTPQGIAAGGGRVLISRAGTADSVVVNDLGLVIR